ncbi:MAG: isocitrate dehydrogenase (NADP(+)) [Gemmatimonadota bacterium]|jgi:isocitrate dehydrogenase|nr:isocitrate dehydrogenase (NADP(+)) [Gemmatimonadota bacterium]MDP6461293.1 isocitrate dehydrogenase (NADP(+)) [Gemmatimonadota bacterium]MDP6529925.1 isocitrate dehydrogenase (NADP(+)) [Gemmatimonadota bacterium]MDP6802962.1 isocitrate dehydrogenase (NADP(+)) [Gemmatimonadota bacterium]
MNNTEAGAPALDRITPPQGERITAGPDGLIVPDHPVIPVIEGDGIGRDIMRATRTILDAAVEKSYEGRRKIAWFDVYAGERANEEYGEWLPEDTFEAIRHFVVALKGPLTTPVGGGFRSLNVTLRQVLDLYACVRPVRYFRGVPSPVVSPEKMNVVIFRENTEDVYAGIEYRSGTPEAEKVLAFLRDEMGAKIRDASGLGIKPISAFGTKRLVKKAIRHALDRDRSSVTLVHKGNIMKFTEGAFRDWGYELAEEEFAGETVREDTLDGPAPDGRIVMKDRIADSMFQQILTRTDEYSVLAMPNLNGDYLSDACAAQVGGLGMAPGANLGDSIGLFEATHGTAPKYADQDKVNPGSLLLSGVMMLDYLGWSEASVAIEAALEETILQKRVTYDLARLMGDVKPLSTSGFAEAVVENLPA